MNKHFAIIAGIIVLLFSGCWALFEYGEGHWKTFGEHGLVETVAMAITILGIDTLQRRRDELRLLPRRRAAHEDVSAVLSTIVFFWTAAYRNAVPERLPRRLEDLFTPQILSRKIAVYVSMTASAPVAPARSWADYWPQFQIQTKANASAALARHGDVLDPEVYADLHTLITAINEPELIGAVRQTRGQIAPLLAGELLFDDARYCAAVIALVKWCNAQAKRLERELKIRRNRIDMELSQSDPLNPPPSMASPELVAAMYAQLAEQDRTQAEWHRDPREGL